MRQFSSVYSYFVFLLNHKNVITTTISDIFLNEKMISFSIIGNKLTMK